MEMKGWYLSSAAHGKTNENSLLPRAFQDD
jgi:hypothetical protein